jgi:hypothetical protein
MSSKTKKKSARKLEPKYLEALNRMIDQLYQEAFRQKLDWETLANKSGLAISTIQRLASRQTQLPQFRTIELLAQALGGKVQFSKKAKKITWTLKMFKPPKKKAA